MYVSDGNIKWEQELADEDNETPIENATKQSGIGLVMMRLSRIFGAGQGVVRGFRLLARLE